jgi:type II secretory pathway component PulJ
MCTWLNPNIHGPFDGPGHRSRLAGDAGFTLIELLVAAGLAITLLGGTFAMLESSQRIQARDTEFALTLQEGRVGIARMLREIRQASKVEEANANSIFFVATVGGKKWNIKYDCGVTQAGTSFHECVRYATEGATLPGTGASIAREVLNETPADLSDPVFVYSPSKAHGQDRAARRGDPQTGQYDWLHPPRDPRRRRRHPQPEPVSERCNRHERCDRPAQPCSPLPPDTRAASR